MRKTRVMPVITPLILLLLLLFVPSRAYANDITSLETTAEIQNNGDLKIRQIWKVKADKGTEIYVPMQYLNHMEIRDLSVWDETERHYKVVDDWNPKETLEWKAYKCAIYQGSDGPELCFGPSGYGEKTYYVNYTYTNAVQHFIDRDGFNIRFVNDNMNPAPDHVKTVIRVPLVKLSEENAGIWAFGYEGSIHFVNGEVVAESSRPFTKKNYMNIVLELHHGIVHPNYQGKDSFAKLLETAKEGSDYDSDDDPMETVRAVGGFIAIVILVAAGIGLVAKSKAKKIDPSEYPVPLNEHPHVEYWRDVPLDGRLDAIAYFRGASKTKDDRYLFAAYLMKWVMEQALLPKPEGQGVAFDIIGEPRVQSDGELALWTYLKQASPKGTIRRSTLKDHISKKPSAFGKLFSSMRRQCAAEAVSQGYAQKKRKGLKRLVFLNESGQRVYEEILGLRMYLKDFTLLDERDLPDVYYWEYYLILAVLFGVAEKVLKRMSELNPQFSYITSLDGVPASLLLTSTVAMAQSGVNVVHAYRTGSYRGGGGGGSASLTGGGGFSGGGSGGGIR